MGRKARKQAKVKFVELRLVVPLDDAVEDLIELLLSSSGDARFTLAYAEDVKQDKV